MRRALLNPEVTFVVPSLGTSRHLKDCLESAVSSDGVEVDVRLVHPASFSPELADLPGLQLQTTPAPVGFSEACNLGIVASGSEFVALLNDDAVVERDWARHLTSAISSTPGAAAAQGVNLQMADPDRVDGRGLEWNRRLQAIQIGRGGQLPPTGGQVEEIFGVSATAAIYRRTALDAVALSDIEFFDVGLESYYEDVDLACRLRGAGFTALCAPAARALHAGAVTTERLPMHRYSLIYGNRYLVLARTLGRTYWSRLPRLLGRDLLDLGRAALAFDYRRSIGILGGWVRGARNLRLYAHRGHPTISMNSSPTDVER